VDIWGDFFVDFWCTGKVRFCWDLQENGRVNVVFLWSGCGKLHGKRGVLRDSFSNAK
jgi:ribosomal protein L35AE/L33A